ncbi:conserved hypothetical protein [uncultured Desulfobacterium sp.]|uniref:Uncharacterized protein n=1 Tax=uncultured Desulfobacterium sp. TaxID=201089 RepID=A0A445MWA4_9BACT|nr:conserved hypothetical protein [uncultured Desulfobacterium sp.]
MVAIPTQLPLPWSKIQTQSVRAGAFRVKDSVREALKGALDKAYSEFGMDREAVANELSRLVGEQVSVHTINNWLSEAKTDRRFPLEYVKALALICGDTEIIDAALGPEFSVMDEAGRAVYEYGAMVLEDKVRGKARRRLEEKAIRSVKFEV